MKRWFNVLVLGLLVAVSCAAVAGTYEIDVFATEGTASGEPVEVWTLPYGGLHTGWGQYYIGYYKFQLPNAPGERITSASVQLLFPGVAMPGLPMGRMYFQWIADDSWTPGTMTWTNAPTTDYMGIVNTGVYAEIGEWASTLLPADVTGLIANEGPELNGQFVTFALFGTDFVGEVHNTGLFAFPNSTLKLETAPVPEPSSIVALLGGLSGCLFGALRRRSQ